MDTITRDESKGSVGYVYLICIVAAVGGLLFGFDTAVWAGADPFLTAHFELNAFWEGFCAGSVLVGCIFGACFAGVVSDRFGRRRVLILCAVLFILSAIGSAIPRSMMEFVAARFIGGLGVGAASMLSPLYIAEISPPQIRGRLVSLNQLTIVGGMLAAYFVDYALVDIGESNWRWMFASETLPAALFLVFLFFVPESPRWLTKQERGDEALAILTRVNGAEQAHVEIREIKEIIQLESGSLRQIFQPGLRIALMIGIALAIFQQITGINVILYYAPKIFKSMGSGTNAALLQTVAIGAVNLSFTLVAIWVIDWFGRKPLLLIGSAGMGISLLLLGCAFFMESSLLRENDIYDWPGFCAKVNEERNQTSPNPSRRLWEHLSTDARQAIEKTTQDTNVSQESKSLITFALNEVLNNIDFYHLDSFQQIELSDDAQSLINQSSEPLTNKDIQKLNRLLLEAAYPEQIAKSAYKPIVLLLILCYIACFATSMGPVVWVLLSEIYPTRIRGGAMSIATVCLWLACYLVTQTFPMMLETLKGGWTFCFYAAVCAAAFLFIWRSVPETKGKSLEEIEKRWLV